MLTNKELASSHNHGHVKQEEESILENKKHIEVTPTNWIPPVEAGSDEQVLVPNTKFSSRQNSKDSGFEGEQASTDEEDGIEVISSEPVEHDAVGAFFQDTEDSKDSGFEFEREQASIYEDDDIEVISEPVEDDGIEVISEIDKIDIALKVSSRWDSKEGSSSFHESLEKSSTVLSKNSKSSDSDDVFANSCSSLYLNSLQWSLVSDCESSMLGIPSSL